MTNAYSHFIAKSTHTHYIALAKRMASHPIDFMGLDESVKSRIELLLANRKMSVNALAKASGLRESSIRAILNGTTRSTTLATVDKLAKGFDVPPGYLMNVDQAPIQATLLIELLKRLLRPLLHRERLIEAVAQSVVRAYAVGRDSGVDPLDPRDLDILTGLEVDRIQVEDKRSKA